jgi:hypothetical protein
LLCKAAHLKFAVSAVVKEENVRKWRRDAGVIPVKKNFVNSGFAYWRSERHFYNDIKQFLFYFNEVTMYKPMQRNAKLRAEPKALGLNINKIQAAACILASAAVSIGLIYLAIIAIF